MGVIVVVVVVVVVKRLYMFLMLCINFMSFFVLTGFLGDSCVVIAITKFLVYA